MLSLALSLSLVRTQQVTGGGFPSGARMLTINGKALTINGNALTIGT